MSFQKQLKSFVQAHQERNINTSHFWCPDYKSGLTDNDLNSCMKELSSIVHSPDFGVVQSVCDDSGYELISDFEEI